MNSNTVTKTTTTTSYTDNGGYNNNAPPPQSRQTAVSMRWIGGSFKSAKETVAKASFEDTKLSTAKTILASNCFNTDQVIQICKLFGFEASKLDFAKYAYARTTDAATILK